MKNKVRIAIYSRKSKFSEKGDSVGNQVDIANKYIQEHYPLDEYEVEIIIFEDDGFSGGNLDRPKFKEFLIEENKNPFDILICYRLDRISRNIADFSNLINSINKLGTSFVSIKEQFDTKTPMGRAMMYIASVFAQLEREVITERIRDNMIELAKTGRWLGGITPTGYSSKRIDIVDVYEKRDDNIIEKKRKTASKLIIIKEEIKIIEKIYYKFLELKSLSKLEVYFVQNNIYTKNNIDFSVSTLRTILTNPVYAPNDKYIVEYFNNKGMTIYADGDRANFDGKYGLLGYRKRDGKNENDIEDWIISVGLHTPAIKDGLVWIRAQELLNKNREKRYRAKCKHDFLFSGILRCSECGSYMRPKIAQGKRFYYICELKEKSKRQKCNSKNISGLELDKLVMQKLREIFIPYSYIYEEFSKMIIKKFDSDIENQIQELKIKFRNNEESIKKLIDKLKYIDIEIIDYINNEIKNLKKENKKIQEDLLNLQQHKEIREKDKNENCSYLNLIDNELNLFDFLDIKFKKDILKILIKDMKGNGKNIEINLFNIKINQTDKRLFTDIIEETTNKKTSMLSAE